MPVLRAIRYKWEVQGYLRFLSTGLSTCLSTRLWIVEVGLSCDLKLQDNSLEVFVVKGVPRVFKKSGLSDKKFKRSVWWAVPDLNR